MELKYPKEENDKMREGTLAHTVAADRLLGKDVIYGAEVTDEMLEGADLWFSVFGGYNGVQVEKKVIIDKDCWGTTDAWAYHFPTHRLHAGDYKYGHGFVDAVENWQLISYACAIALGLPEWPKTVDLTIVQPRCFTAGDMVRTWTITGEELREYLDEIRERIVVMLGENPLCVTGEECLYCSAAHSCQTLGRAVAQVIGYMSEPVAFDLPAGAISRELNILYDAQVLLKARTGGVLNEVSARIKSGKAIPGWRLENAYGRQEWSKPLAEVVALGNLMGIDISSPGAITPKQAIKAGLPAELVNSYSEVKKSELKLVQDDGSKAKEAFGGNK
jgi:hypothetical protein